MSQPADAGSIKPSLVDSRYSPVLLLGDVAQHHGLAEAMDGVAQGSSMPRDVVLLDALACSGGLLQLAGSHACKAAQQALALIIQLAWEHVQDAPALLEKSCRRGRVQEQGWSRRKTRRQCPMVLNNQGNLLKEQALRDEKEDHKSV